MTIDDEFYARAIGRITWLTAGLAIVGGVVAWVMRGPQAAGGFAVGAVISLANLEMFKMIGKVLGQGGGGPGKTSAGILFGARYLVAGIGIYAIVRITQIALGAVFAGLLVSGGAVLLEILYEITFLRL
ncbi:MAG TPA: hypothetical protein VGN17_17220 [Bryobacteraceae bacterium]|jgi:hypothetical protein